MNNMLPVLFSQLYKSNYEDSLKPAGQPQCECMQEKTEQSESVCTCLQV